jgi:hypothetical protein
MKTRLHPRDAAHKHPKQNRNFQPPIRKEVSESGSFTWMGPVGKEGDQPMDNRAKQNEQSKET